ARLWPAQPSLADFVQQGPKLVGTGAVGVPGSQQGTSVAVSADGNTAIVGGQFDNSQRGAAWVYTRSGGVWTQQGAKLVGAAADKTTRASPAACLPTAIPPSWAGVATAAWLGRGGWLGAAGGGVPCRRSRLSTTQSVPKTGDAPA